MPHNDQQHMQTRIPVDTLVLYLLMMTYGVSTTLIGTILLQLLGEFGLPMARGGIFYSVLNIGCFIGILSSGILIERFHPTRLNLYTYGMLALLLLCVSATRTLTAYLAVSLVLGMMSKLLDASVNACIAQKHTANPGFYMNLLHASFGTGSFFGPLLAGFLLEKGFSWRSPYLMLGCFCLLVGAAYYALSRRESANTAETARAAAPAAYRTLLTPRVLVLLAIIFLYCGHQMGMNNWVPAYLQERFGTETAASGFGLSVFWAGLIVCRLGCSLLTRRYPERRLLQIGMALGSGLLLLGVLLGSEWAAFAGSAAAGLLTGATIPMVLTLVYGWHPESRGKITMLFFTAISMGGVFFPWLMGLVGGAFGLDKAMLLNGGLLAAAFVLCLGIPQNPPRTEETA